MQYGVLANQTSYDSMAYWQIRHHRTTEQCTVWGFPGGLNVKESACSAGDLGLGDPLERGLATHCGILTWRIPWTEESGGL